MSSSIGEAFTHIPIIDLADATSPNLTLRQKLADKIKVGLPSLSLNGSIDVIHVKEACMEVGFFYISNHAIPPSTFTAVLNAMKSFFNSLALSQKIEIHNKKSPTFKGYSPLLSGNNNPQNKGDLQEGFEFSYEPLTLSADWAPDMSPLGPNQWPAGCPGFREGALEYYHAALEVGTKLFPLFALALGLPETWFEDKTRGKAALMRLLYYPPQEPRQTEEDEQIIGIGSHTDWECFTILFQQPGLTALQVLNPKNEWIDAPPIEGTLVINLGDQFARWTNDMFKSTIHRVINTTGSERYSVPLFFGTDYDVRLEPIPGTVTPSNPPRYEVITAGEYIKKKLKETYGH